MAKARATRPTTVNTPATAPLLSKKLVAPEAGRVVEVGELVGAWMTVMTVIVWPFETNTEVVLDGELLLDGGREEELDELDGGGLEGELDEELDEELEEELEEESDDDDDEDELEDDDELVELQAEVNTGNNY
jgi:hypothetical protein